MTADGYGFLFGVMSVLKLTMVTFSELGEYIKNL